MSKGEEISKMIDKLLSMDLNDLKKDKKEEIIYTINEIIINSNKLNTDIAFFKKFEFN